MNSVLVLVFVVFLFAANVNAIKHSRRLRRSVPPSGSVGNENVIPSSSAAAINFDNVFTDDGVIGMSEDEEEDDPLNTGFSVAEEDEEAFRQYIASLDIDSAFEQGSDDNSNNNPTQ